MWQAGHLSLRITITGTESAISELSPQNVQMYIGWKEWLTTNIHVFEVTRTYTLVNHFLYRWVYYVITFGTVLDVADYAISDWGKLDKEYFLFNKKATRYASKYGFVYPDQDKIPTTEDDLLKAGLG